MRLTASLLVVALATLGCTGNSPSSTSVAALPTPTSRPTERPTPAPTPSLSPSPTGDQAAYTAFIDRSAAWGAAIQPIQVALNEALSADDLDGYVTYSRQERTLDLQFMDWLDANPPRACYEQMWTLTRAGASDSAAGRGYFITYATVSFDDADARKGGDLLNTSKEDIDRATALIMSIHCAE